MQRSGLLETADAWTRGRPWVADGLLAALLALLTLPTSAAGIWGGGWPHVERVAVVALLVLGHLVLAVRRTAPRLSFVVVVVLMLALLTTPDLGASTAERYDGPVPAILLPSAAIFWVVLYSVAAWCPPRTSLIALTVSLVGALLAGARVSSGAGLVAEAGTTWMWSVAFSLGLVASVIAAWSSGRFRRVRAQYVVSLEERAVLEQENRDRYAAAMLAQERSRIAREMHDVVSHSLAVMVSQAEGGRMMAAKDPSVTVPALETIARTGQEAMRGMRGILDALDPTHTSGQAPPQPTIADVERLLARVREAGVNVALREVGAAVPVGAHVEVAAYRIVQEALTNVLKHGRSVTAVSVEITWGAEQLRLRVRDDGRAVLGEEVVFGRGLTGMRERLAVLGGSLVAVGERDGFVVDAVIPTEGAGR